MVRRWCVLAALVLAGGLLAALPVSSADEKPKADPDDKAAETDLELATTAYKTAEFGRANKAPEALVAAALMLRSLKNYKLEAIAEQPTDEDGKPIVDKALETPSFATQANDLFDEASALALTLKIDNFDAYITAAKKREIPLRAVIGGARSLRRKVEPGKTEVFHFKFENKKNCEVAIHASHPVHFFVEHENNHDVWANAVFADHTSHGNPAGKPGGQATVVVKVHNTGKKPAEYTLTVR